MNLLIEVIHRNLQTSGLSFDYRVMHSKLRENGCTIDAETVGLIIKVLDPGVAYRTTHRSRSRTNRCAGPNHLWHIGGYDKLKTFRYSALRNNQGIESWWSQLRRGQKPFFQRTIGRTI